MDTDRRPKVSLITPCYNAGAYLKEYLESVIAQTWRPLEFIFVDDGSTDDSLKIARETAALSEDPQLEIKVLSIPHAGQAAALSAGLSVFTGEYLAWADADDLLDLRNVEEKVRFLEAHPEYGMVRNDADRLENGTHSAGVAKKEDREETDLFERLLLETTYVFAGCYMMRRSLFLECYPDRKIPYSKEGQNLQMLLPAASRTKVGFVDKVLMTYRIHPDSHAFRKRSLQEVLERMQGFEKLLRDLKPCCAVESGRYDKLCECRTREAREQLSFSLSQNYKKEKNVTRSRQVTE